MATASGPRDATARAAGYAASAGSAGLGDYHRDEVAACMRCGLRPGCRAPVPGEGDAGAALMLVGEAPGYREEREGRPFRGAGGDLLDELLAGIGLDRGSVFLTNALKCRPPGNRDAHPAELRGCEPHLYRQVALVRPRVVCAMGNVATKLLTGRPEGVARARGHARPAVIAGVPVTLLPVFHPAAALHAPALQAALREDFARIPELLARAGHRPAPGPVPPPEAPPVAPAAATPAPVPPPRPAAEQLGLF